MRGSFCEPWQSPRADSRVLLIRHCEPPPFLSLVIAMVTQVTRGNLAFFGSQRFCHCEPAEAGVAISLLGFPTVLSLQASALSLPRHCEHPEGGWQSPRANCRTLLCHHCEGHASDPKQSLFLRSFISVRTASSYRRLPRRDKIRPSSQ